MKFQALTEPDVLLSLLPERIEEYNRMQRDSREQLTLLSAEPSALQIRVGQAREEAAATDFVGTASEDADGMTCITGALCATARGKKRFFAVLYGLLLSGAARLTLLVLLYGAILGISLLVGGESFWLPALPSVAIALWMTCSALRVALTKRRRIVAFFTAFVGCTQLVEDL
jgi:hypothetical protein